MRIEFYPEGVRIYHGLNDEGKMELSMRTHDVIVVEVDASVPSGNLEFRTGKFIVEPRIRGTVRERAELLVSTVAHEGRANCSCALAGMRHHAMNCPAAMDGCCK